MSIVLKDYILDVPDFPKPGIVFKDITPIVQSPQAFNAAVDMLAAWARTRRPEILAGIESRGFLFAAALARELRLGMTVIRKEGKLPRKCASVVAPNEYAVERFEMHEDAVAPGQRVLIIDDLIATGSSSVSAINLVRLLKGEGVGFGAIVELSFLKGVAAVLIAQRIYHVTGHPVWPWEIGDMPPDWMDAIDTITIDTPSKAAKIQKVKRGR